MTKCLKIVKKNKTYRVYLDLDMYEFFKNRTIYIRDTTSRNKTHYARFRFEGKNKYVHQFIMGKKQGFQIDHLNRNGLDNRRCNLRFVTQSQNKQNSASNSKYGKGIQKRIYKNGTVKYRARIRYQKKLENLGEYFTILEAQKAYNKRALELFGRGCYLNPVKI